MIRDIYASSLSADKNLLNAVGVSSFESLSWDDIQNRIDTQISRYTNSLNMKSRVLLALKETLQNVNDFHKTIYSVQNVFEDLDGSVSISYLEYSFKGSTPLEINEFMLKENAERVVNEEEKLFQKFGYDVNFTENKKSKWYKTTSKTMYLGSVKK